jgi:hypothetical protein
MDELDLWQQFFQDEERPLSAADFPGHGVQHPNVPD